MKVLVSACIMGTNCKYNGKNNKNLAVINFLKDKEVISICPEVLAGMKIPRPCAEIVNGIVVDENGNETKEVKKIIGTTKPKIQISKGDDCFVITATDESGIDKVVIKRTSDNKSFTMKAKDNEKEYKCEFPLEEGENRIEITVYNINGATEQAKAKLTKK